MKYIFETEDDQEALMVFEGKHFYGALSEIFTMLRFQDKHGFDLRTNNKEINTQDVVSAIMDKVNEIIHTEAPCFTSIL